MTYRFIKPALGLNRKVHAMSPSIAGNMNVMRGRISKKRLPGVLVLWMIQANAKANATAIVDEIDEKIKVLVRRFSVLKCAGTPSPVNTLTRNSVLKVPLGSPGNEVQNMPKRRKHMGTTISTETKAEITNSMVDVCPAILLAGSIILALNGCVYVTRKRITHFLFTTGSRNVKKQL